ncbi:MAG: sarcosine oxidase subunit alpha family protein, partial [Oricola sp.]|nr:sarcosine oxidase subunit alpha family protein [Oricola sp.]
IGEPRHRHWVIRADCVVLATGALERPLVFPGNDRPGVMLASAAQRFASEYGVLPGKRIVVLTNNDSAYDAAAKLRERDALITTIVDVRPTVGDWALAQAKEAGAEVLASHAVVATGGRNSLSSVTVQPFDAEINAFPGPPRRVACDTLLVSGGWSPVVHLASQAGAKPVWDDKLQAFLPPGSSSGWKAVGAAAGEGLEPPAPLFEIKAKRDKAFVDFQHDVTADDVRLAHREGYQSVEHLKRYTTLGMATDQGKTSNVTGLAIMAAARGLDIPEVGTTRFRPPFTPVAMGAIAGERFGHANPHRLTPMHDWHKANGGGMMANGLWWRPEAYCHSG